MDSLGMFQTWSEVIDLLKMKMVLKSIKVEQAMLAVDRCHYTTRFPYSDEAQDLGFRSWICAPHMHAFVLEVLSPKLVPGAKVLDVGSGSGYLTACMATMVGPKGLVVGIEHIKQLVETSVDNITKGNPELFRKGIIRMYYGDGRAGVPLHAPYDIIFVGASRYAPTRALLEQVKAGGRLLMPIDTNKEEVQTLTAFEKMPSGRFTKTSVARVKYSPLRDRVRQWPWDSMKNCIDVDSCLKIQKNRKHKKDS